MSKHIHLYFTELEKPLRERPCSVCGKTYAVNKAEREGENK